MEWDHVLQSLLLSTLQHYLIQLHVLWDSIMMEEETVFLIHRFLNNHLAVQLDINMLEMAFVLQFIHRLSVTQMMDLLLMDKEDVFQLL
jgi:hypothetical protein